MHLNFFKYQGTGNDFIILDNRTQSIQLTQPQIATLCNRKFGIGADGLMLLQNKNKYDFEMIYYNADGNLGSMCGNGGRCLVQFANDCGIKKLTYHFIATDGEHQAKINENNHWVELKMNDVLQVHQVNEDVELDTGSPHYIRACFDVMNKDIITEAKKIRYNNIYTEKGINVNFVEQTKPDTIVVRTYERGVEDETLSCGTGVTASALVFAHNQNGFNHIDVITKGGKLAVEFIKISDSHFKDIWLSGAATFVYKGEITI